MAGKHRLIKPKSKVRTFAGVSTAVVAFGITSAVALTPVASADSQGVALQAYSTPMTGPIHHDDHGHGALTGRRIHRPILFRAPIRRGHWDNVCGPHRVFVPRLHRTVVENSCARLWRDW